MKRLIIYLVCSAFLISLGGNVMAVEKKDKKPIKKEVVLKKNKKSTKKIPLSTTKSKKRVLKKKYDTFIDKNKNGIDDRKENLKQKPAAKVSKKKEEEKK